MDSNDIGEQFQGIAIGEIKLGMIINWGIKVFPNGFKETFCKECWRCRFNIVNGNNITKQEIM